MQVIAVANQKGGVGKTTSTLNLGAALVEQGYKVLLLDLDPQSSLTRTLGLVPSEVSPSIYEALKAMAREELEGQEGPTLVDTLYETELGVDLCPSNLNLSAGEAEFPAAYGSEFLLRDLLEQAELEYDYMLIDCPPSLGVLTANAMAVADYVLIPLQTEAMALHGLGIFLSTLSKIQRRINRNLKILGILLTMSDMRTKHAREVIETVEEELGSGYRILGPIRQDVRVREASAAFQSVLHFAPNSRGAEAYRTLSETVVEIVGA